MQQIHARNVILGAGAMGSAAAYHLARRGEPVLLVEQFTLGHSFGSSHGAARIIRHSYADPRYARLMPEAFRAWRALEAEAGEPLYIRTGGVSFCPSGVDYVERVASSLDEIGVPYRRMTGDQLRRVQPVFVVPDSYDVVFEPDAGLISAARAISVEIDLARSLGGESTRILENRPVRRIDLEADRPTLLTDDAEITAERLIVAAGPWVGELLAPVGSRLRPTRQQVLYFQPRLTAPFLIGRFPVFIYKGPLELDAFYGLPNFLGGGVKVARHGGPEVDLECVDRTVDLEYVDLMRHFLRGHIPALADAPIYQTEVCLYTMAPDENFLVGPWPGRPDVLVASPCSGHGFKFSCLIGQVLADLVQSREPSIDIGLWSITEQEDEKRVNLV